MTIEEIENAPVLTGQALDNSAAQTALDLEALLKQGDFHLFGLALSDEHYCLISRFDDFSNAVEPLLSHGKFGLRTLLGVALQELAAYRLCEETRADCWLDELPMVTTLSVPEFLEAVSDEGVVWHCPDEGVHTAIQSALEAKRMQFVAPGHGEKHIVLDPRADGIEELFMSIFSQLAQPGTLGTQIVFDFDAQGQLLSATDVFEESHQFVADDVPAPVRFRAKAMLDVVNLKIYSDWGTQLCDATLATASEFADTQCLAEKLFDLYFGEGIYDQRDEPIEIPVSRWLHVETSLG